MDLGVNGGGADVAVTQQLLDVPEVRPSLKEMGRTGVAESVRMNRETDAGRSSVRAVDHTKLVGIRVTPNQRFGET